MAALRARTHAIQVRQFRTLGVAGVGQRAPGGTLARVQLLAAKAAQVAGAELRQQGAARALPGEMPFRPGARAQAQAGLGQCGVQPFGRHAFGHFVFAQRTEQRVEVGELGDFQLTGRQVEHGQPPGRGVAGFVRAGDGGQRGDRAGVEQAVIGERARGHDAHHAALHRALAVGVAELFGHRHTLALAHQPPQVLLAGVHRHAGHRHLLAAALAAAGQRDVQQPGGAPRVVEEQLVKVAHAIEQQPRRVLRLQREVLGNHRRVRHGRGGGRRGRRAAYPSGMNDTASAAWEMLGATLRARGERLLLIEASAGEVAGLKSATVHLRGEYAYGWLRTETGVHRLVRKSPFDSGARRHTSFAAVFVSPEIDDSFEIDIDPSDLRVDVYRASGAGGQHVNRTESAVRITHNPTGIVVQCQNDRSQHKNRATAMKQLRAKLYELEMQKRNTAAQAQEDAKSDIGWGSQIRSYVLDQSRIKDLRTGVEIGNTQAVLDGDLNPFLEASLKEGL